MVIITAVGDDRPGMAHALADKLARLGCNIEDTTMTRLSGEFAMILVVEPPAALSLAALDGELRPLAASHGLFINCKTVPAVAAAPTGGARYIVSAYGPDKAGLLASLTGVLARQGADITDVQTRVAAAGAVYVMIFEIEIAPTVNEAALQAALNVVARDIDVRVTMRAIEEDALLAVATVARLRRNPMPERPVLLVPDPRLQERCAAVERWDEALASTIADLEDTMRAHAGCVGIAAPQIGALCRVAIVDTSGHKKHGPFSQGRLVLVNPVLTARHGERLGREGCLSLPDFTANVLRAAAITVAYQDAAGQQRIVNAEDYEAVVVQHEIDHLDGILFLDRVANLATDVFPRKHKA